jgi:toxin ParE1/3/4
MPVRVRPLAEADIDSASSYLWQENPQAAIRFLEELELAFARLAEQPGMGSPRYAHLLIEGNLRMWTLATFPYLVFYLERPDHLDVVRVLHEVRDLPRLLQE